MNIANPYQKERHAIRTEAGLSSHPLQDADLSHVVGLATVCLESDGGLPLIATEAFLRERFWKFERQFARR
ncbi:MAG TPA: hypothetical protein VKU00_22435 [Chthonomonadaceae bacterium]|nr:hypothetical protein [Chthonomonadaceae bacterium]